MHTMDRIVALIAVVLNSLCSWSENGWEASHGAGDAAYLALVERMYAKRGNQLRLLEGELAALEADWSAYAHAGDGVEYYAHEGYFAGHAEGVEYENGPFG